MTGATSSSSKSSPASTRASCSISASTFSTIWEISLSTFLRTRSRSFSSSSLSCPDCADCSGCAGSSCCCGSACSVCSACLLFLALAGLPSFFPAFEVRLVARFARFFFVVFAGSADFSVSDPAFSASASASVPASACVSASDSAAASALVVAAGWEAGAVASISWPISSGVSDDCADFLMPIWANCATNSLEVTPTCLARA